MRKTRGESCSTVGKCTRFPAKPEYEATQAAILFPILIPWVSPLTARSFNFLVAMQQVTRAFIETIHLGRSTNMESTEQEKDKQNPATAEDQDNMAATS